MKYLPFVLKHLKNEYVLRGGVLLAAVEMYGVLAYSIALRRREIGIRAALGASSSRLLRVVSLPLK